jgi:very-short-patch-repair endonuclease
MAAYLNIAKPDIAKQWHPTKNGDLKPDMVLTGSNKKVWWLCDEVCPEGCLHEWEAVIISRTRVNGSGCPYCSNKKLCLHTSIQTTDPHIAREWHPTKNGISPQDVGRGSAKKVWWLCSNKCAKGCIHEWKTAVEGRTKSGTGCPYCCKPAKKICEHSSITHTDPHIAREWHPTKNGDLLASHVSYFSDRKVWWLCPKVCAGGCVHEYECTIGNRHAGRGCPWCSRKQICEHGSILHTHPERAKFWHPTKNASIDIKTIAHGTHTEVWWLCPKKCPGGCPHEWKETVKNYIHNNNECSWCSIPSKKVCEHISVASLYPALMDEWHATKNEGINPKMLKPCTHTYINWICKKDPKHEWRAILSSRARKCMPTGCPLCVYKTEMKVYDFLINYYPSLIKEFRMDSCKLKFHLPFDFCIPELMVLIEVDGGQHFRQVRNWGDPQNAMKRDIFKMRKAKEAGYKVIRIVQEDVYDNDEEWLRDHILPEIVNPDRNDMFISLDGDLYNDHKALLESGVRIVLDNSEED